MAIINYSINSCNYFLNIKDNWKGDKTNTWIVASYELQQEK